MPRDVEFGLAHLSERGSGCTLLTVRAEQEGPHGAASVVTWRRGGRRPCSDATMVHYWRGQTRVVSACPLDTLPFQNSCHIRNFVVFGALKFNFPAITF